MDKRKYKRFDCQLRVKLDNGSIISWGLLNDISENGLFIKCIQDFNMGTAIDIEIFLPDNTNAFLKGVIKRKIELTEPFRKHGLGIELIEKDARYISFMKSLLEKSEMETVDVAS